MSKQAKRDRGALRQIVKEEMPALMQAEAFNALRIEMYKTLDKIANDVQASLKQMQERQKDVQNYLIREVSAGQKVSNTSDSKTE